MAVPPGFSIRVANFLRNAPYHVSVHLPSTDKDAPVFPRLNGPHLDVVVPASDDRHLLLGKFMDAWSRLERQLTFFVSTLLECDLRTAGHTQSSMGMRQILDLLTGLSQLKLTPQHCAQMTTLLERVRKQNGKRNVLVHGMWVLEANVYVKRGTPVVNSQFVRELTPVDPEKAKAISDPRNQRERVKYLFNLRRLAGTIRETEAVAIDLGNFRQGMQLSSAWKRQRQEFFSEQDRLDALWSTYRDVPIHANRVTHSIQI